MAEHNAEHCRAAQGGVGAAAGKLLPFLIFKILTLIISMLKVVLN
jgi:hypothetical protein